MKYALRTSVVGLMAALLLVLGCTKKDTTGPANHPPEISSVSASSDSVGTGELDTLFVTYSDPDGDSATHIWSSDSGRVFHANRDTAFWAAPSTAGLYDVRVNVFDGTDSTEATVSIQVGEYTPAETLYYVGSQSCNEDCHTSILTWWGFTAHADAYTALVNRGRGDDPQCLVCHTVGWDLSVNNGGFDEQMVDRLAGVQCENCHGPGSFHASAPDSLREPLESPLIAQFCAGCHQTQHHPYLNEWQASAHSSSDLAAGGQASDPGCADCHTAEGFLATLHYDYTLPGDPQPLVCIACHHPHRANYSGQLRLPAGVGETGLCEQCHMRDCELPDTISYETPRHIQYSMLTGIGGHEYDTTYERSQHTTLFELETCLGCHFYRAEDDTASSHTFQPRLAACAAVGCHSGAADFNIDSKQDSINTWLNSLYSELDAYPDVTDTTGDFWYARFNYDFVKNDGSKGIHNYKYAKKLLLDAIGDFEP